ncbi:2',3'-cyclic-nucleotide 3'-phosphodiesterase, partial [Stegodyphus mimosarum]
MASLFDYDDSESEEESTEANAVTAAGPSDPATETSLDSAKYFSLVMVKDRKTEMYVKFAKVMVIFQYLKLKHNGNILKHLAEKFKTTGYIISDSTFSEHTLTPYDPENTDAYYSYFKERCKEGCKNGANLIVIAPSMTNMHQNEYYLYLAQKTQYVVLVVPPLVTENYPSDHGQAKSFLDINVKIKSSNNFQHLFCAWFLHEKDSVELRNEAELYVRDCFENSIDFKDYFSKICSVEDFRTHYNLHHKRQDLAYCMTAMFRSIIDTHAYFREESVQKFYGKMAKLFIVGFIVSPHMIAARVKLTQEQKKLWKLPNDLEESCPISVYPSELIEKSKVKQDVEVTLSSSKCNRTLTYSGQTIHAPTESILPYFRGRSCHIVLGRVTDAPIRNADYDVQYAVYRETNAIKSNADFHDDDIGRSIVRRIGRYWFVYLKETLCVEGFFTSYVKAENYDIRRV